MKSLSMDRLPYDIKVYIIDRLMTDPVYLLTHERWSAYLALYGPLTIKFNPYMQYDGWQYYISLEDKNGFGGLMAFCGCDEDLPGLLELLDSPARKFCGDAGPLYKIGVDSHTEAYVPGDAERALFRLLRERNKSKSV